LIGVLHERVQGRVGERRLNRRATGGAGSVSADDAASGRVLYGNAPVAVRVGVKAEGWCRSSCS